MHSVCVYRSTFKDDINKSATARLVKKVKGNNKSFLERDIHSKRVKIKVGDPPFVGKIEYFKWAGKRSALLYLVWLT